MDQERFEARFLFLFCPERDLRYTRSCQQRRKAPILTDQRLQNIGKLAQSKSAGLELSVFDQAQFRISY